MYFDASSKLVVSVIVRQKHIFLMALRRLYVMRGRGF